MRFKKFNDIENIRHAKVEEKPIKNYTGNINEIDCPTPSKNTSAATKKEMVEMQGMFKQRNKAIEQSVKNHDPKSQYAIEKYLKDNNLELNKNDTDKIAETGAAIAKKLKNKFERARPYQVAEATGMTFNIMPLESDSMKTPAYPSGHSLQSRLIGEYYAEKYPDHREGLIDAADECGMGRVYAGWHYPSDHNASVKLAKEVYPKINLNRKSLKESIIDIPRKTYARGVFDKADTPNPVLKPSVKKMALDGIKTFEKFGKVVKYTLIGSILTKQYRADADLDINILFDIPGSKAEQEKVHDEIREYQAEINGKNIPGTEHPINYFSIIDPVTFNKARDMADGTFDIDTNKWIKKPEPGTFEPEKYVTDFQKRVSEIDVVKGELVRDMIDYEELKDLTNADIENLSGLVSKKLAEIKDSINTLIDIGDKTIADRKDAFSIDMSPDEIRKFGVKNRLPKNVIYKMLEKYHYLKFFKKLKEIMEDGKISPDELKSLSKIKEARGKSIVFTFGRFNPPTIGHGKLLDKMNSVRADVKRVYLSKSEDSDKNPLKFRQKISLMKRMFPRYANQVVTSNSNQIFEIAVELYKQHFTEIFMIVGSDRVREFETIIKKYNDVKSRHGYYNFDNIKVVSAGERDPDAEGATGMSASKMRAAAAKGDLASFKKGLPRNADAEKIFKDVRKGMNLAANYLHMPVVKPIASMEEFEQQQIRDLYIREMIFNINDEVDYIKEDVKGKVVRRSTNYVVLEDNNNNLHKAWIWDCIPIAADREVQVREHDLDVDYGFEAVSEIKEDLDAQPQDRDVKKKDGTQPKKYYKNLSKDTKSKRADFFKKNKDNKEAPGDKDAKTKPSIHTKKFKQMYGENSMDEACWTGYKQVGFKKKGGKQVPNCVPESMSIEDAKLIDGYVPESYEIGADYANHTKEVTPGEKPSAKPIDSKDKGIEVKKEDVEKWAFSDETIDKYKKRYAEEWRKKLDEVVQRMLEKL